MSDRRTTFSIEVFPPKNDTPVESIYSTLDGLSGIAPDFISCTYGAGGNGTKNATIDICRVISENYHIPSVAHLTCVNSAREDIDEVIAQLRENHIDSVLALRGDRNPNIEPKDDFHHASELIAYLRENAPELHISAACYPETHVDSRSAVTDIYYMKEKESCGAERFISQLFFNNDDYYEFLEKTQIAGIKSPIEAGIMPVTSKKSVMRMISICGASLPKKLTRILNKYEDDPESLREAGIAYAIGQISDLIANDVDGIHLYAMNKPDIAQQIYSAVRNQLSSRPSRARVQLLREPRTVNAQI